MAQGGDFDVDAVLTAEDLAFRKTAFLHRILPSHLAEKTLLTKPLNHGGDYQMI
jgi:hypothetical protein